MDDITYLELLFKIDVIIEYLKDNAGNDYTLYNHTCQFYCDQPNSDIVEDAEDIRELICELKNGESIELPF